MITIHATYSAARKAWRAIDSLGNDTGWTTHKVDHTLENAELMAGKLGAEMTYSHAIDKRMPEGLETIYIFNAGYSHYPFGECDEAKCKRPATQGTIKENDGSLRWICFGTTDPTDLTLVERACAVHQHSMKR